MRRLNRIKTSKSMKNITLITLAAIIAVAFSSCKGTPAVVPAFDAIEKEQNFATTTGNFEVRYHFEYLSTLADPAVLQKIQLAMASDMFGAVFARTDAGGSAAAFDASLHDTYGIRNDSTAFRWDGYLHLTSKAALVGANTVAFTVNRAEDSGGAHGMEETHVSNYDLRTGDRLTLDALFTPEGKAALAETIRARILKDKGVATWEELATRDCYNAAAEVAPTENFTLTATDITFVYNPYDIACYAAGGTRVTLPVANLAGFKKEILE